MPQELKSFLIWVSVIVAVAFMVPCIESIVQMVRRNGQQPELNEVAQVKAPKRRFAGKVA